MHLFTQIQRCFQVEFFDIYVHTTALHNNLTAFFCWVDLILSEFQNHFCACSPQPGQDLKSEPLFGTSMPAAMWFKDCVIVRDIDTMV